MIAALSRLGRIEEIDAARVQALRSLADALDLDSANARMWQVYWDAIEDVMGAGEHVDSGLEEVLAQIRGAGPLGDSPKARAQNA